MDPEIRSDYVRSYFQFSCCTAGGVKSNLPPHTQRIRRNPLSSWSGGIIEIALLHLPLTKGGRSSTRRFMKRLSMEAQTRSVNLHFSPPPPSALTLVTAGRIYYRPSPRKTVFSLVFPPEPRGFFFVELLSGALTLCLSTTILSVLGTDFLLFSSGQGRVFF